MEITYQPLTPERLPDFETLFGAKGACGGCWCMYHRLNHADYEKLKGGGTREAMRNRVQHGSAPGVLAYSGAVPAGWCSVAPREEFVRFAKARVYKPVDDLPVWSINCLFVAKEFRRRGIGSGLIHAAVLHAAGNGARIVEAYPVEPQRDNMPDVFAFVGIASSFLNAGFTEVARRTENRPVMRYYVESAGGG